MNSLDDKLVVNPRDELIQEIAVLREQRLRIVQENWLKAAAERNESLKNRKKEVYELAFKELVRKLLKIGEEDIKKLDQTKIDELEKLIYEVAIRRWKTQRVLVIIAAVSIIGIVALLGLETDTYNEFPTRKIVRLHKWYKKNFGSVATAILHKVEESNALKFKEP